MKYVSFLFLAIVFLISCSDDDTFEQDTSTHEIEAMIEHLSVYFEADTESFTFDDGGIYFEDDIGIDTTDFWETYVIDEKDTQKGYRRHTSLITNTKELKIAFDYNVPFSWKFAMKQAVVEWNKLEGDIIFSIVPRRERNVRVQMRNLTKSTTLARSWLPKDGYPGRLIRINTGYHRTLNSLEKKYAMTHELGHIIGFRHTDTAQGWFLFGLSSICRNGDRNSVMRKGYANSGSTNKEFTRCDKEAYHRLY